MISTKTQIKCFIEGRNYRSPVAEVIGLGYYDGVTNGVLRTYDGSVFTFDMIEEVAGLDDTEGTRRFELNTLPPEAFDRIVAAISEFIPPTLPLWIPIWKFPNQASQDKVNDLIDQQLQQKTAPNWLVETSDLMREISSALRRPESNGGVRDL